MQFTWLSTSVPQGDARSVHWSVAASLIVDGRRSVVPGGRPSGGPMWGTPARDPAPRPSRDGSMGLGHVVRSDTFSSER